MKTGYISNIFILLTISYSLYANDYELKKQSETLFNELCLHWKNKPPDHILYSIDWNFLKNICLNQIQSKTMTKRFFSLSLNNRLNNRLKQIKDSDYGFKIFKYG